MEYAIMDNDTRGWIMCSVSGIACVAGACVICVDLLIRYLPGKANFKIQESNTFLACALALSFGVMIFSALSSMLPSAKKYLHKGHYNPMQTGLLLMGGFAAGVVGIRILSRVIHRVMPSHVVDCDHSHGDAHDHGHAHGDGHDHAHSAATTRHPSRTSRGRHSTTKRKSSQQFGIGILTEEHEQTNVSANESTPLLQSEADQNGGHHPAQQQTGAPAISHGHNHAGHSNGAASKHFSARRPSMVEVKNRTLSFVKDTKHECDADGPCFGYTDPCGQECFKHMSPRSSNARQSSSLARVSTSQFRSTSFAGVPEFEENEDNPELESPPSPSSCRRLGRLPSQAVHDEEQLSCEPMDEDIEAQEPHHHHVPTNAFMDIGFQTVIALAIHKIPEGFITYASNHTNPELGFNVFMALFVHNIAEGFAMALPLYMALGSRTKAIMWSSLLGGLSQPFGAAIAVLIIKITDRGNIEISDLAYGLLFSVTAGIMVSVALQLFVESLSLNHNRNLSILFAFVGMFLIGVSSAVSKRDR